MSRVLILACGNALKGDDGVAPVVARFLQAGFCDPQTEIKTIQQWSPELAEAISNCETVIFVDTSVQILPGEVELKSIVPTRGMESELPSSVTPGELLGLAEKLHGKFPQHAFTLSIGGESFGNTSQFSQAVRQAIPEAIDQIKAVLSGVSLPTSPLAM